MSSISIFDLGQQPRPSTGYLKAVFEQMSRRSQARRQGLWWAMGPLFAVLLLVGTASAAINAEEFTQKLDLTRRDPLFRARSSKRRSSAVAVAGTNASTAAAATAATPTAEGAAGVAGAPNGDSSGLLLPAVAVCLLVMARDEEALLRRHLPSWAPLLEDGGCLVGQVDDR